MEEEIKERESLINSRNTDNVVKETPDVEDRVSVRAVDEVIAQQPGRKASDGKPKNIFQAVKKEIMERRFTRTRKWSEADLCLSLCNFMLLADESVSNQQEVTKKTNKELHFECSCESVLREIITPIAKCCSDNKELYKSLIKCLAAIGITVFMAIALHRNFERALPLLHVWSVVVFYKVFTLLENKFGLTVVLCLTPIRIWCLVHAYWLNRVFIVLIIAAQVLWCVLEWDKEEPKQFVSVAGYFVILFLIYITSKHRKKIEWRPVVLGLILQYIIASIILRSESGYKTLFAMGDFVNTFIGYVKNGAMFVFGPSYLDHSFCFLILPVIIYLSSFMAVLHYFGFIKWLILKIYWLMEFSLGTSATETVAAAANIFLSMVEAPLLIYPYLDDLTTSELFAVMTAGLGTVAGSVLGGYLAFGVKPVYLISAVFMAAPCALAISKLSYPETEKSKFKDYFELKLQMSTDASLLEAVVSGASQSIPLVLNIAASLVVFLALLSAINGLLAWLGGLFGYSQLSFEWTFSYILQPLTLILGVEMTYAFKAAELIAEKIFLNAFIAYGHLQTLRNNRDNGTIPMMDSVTGELNWVDERTEAILTYALCGFSNLPSVAILLAGLSSLVPRRQKEVTDLITRSMLLGLAVSFLNAAIAGFLYIPRPIVCDNIMSTTNWNYTEPSRLLECCVRALENGTSNNSSTSACDCCNYQWNLTEYALNCTGFGHTWCL